MADKEAAERFWAFALRVYGQAHAREAFLRLQDNSGADVPMLLWCLWSGAERRRVSREAMAEAVNFSEAWRRAAVGPLRAVRREMKPGVRDVPAALSEAARQQVATLEQGLERMQMDHLARLPCAAGEPEQMALIALYARVAGLALDPDDVAVITAQN